MKIKCDHYWISNTTYYEGTNVIFTQYRYCPKCKDMTSIPDEKGYFIRFGADRYNELKSCLLENNIEYKLWELEL